VRVETKEFTAVKRTRWILIVVLFISACRAEPSATLPVENEIHPELKNIPLYPGSTAWREGIPGVSQQAQKFQIYSYEANVFKYETLMEFYEEEMLKTGWELLYKTKEGKTKTADLMFAKAKTVAHIQVIPWTANSYLVSVVFYDDPVLED
jgi:hypothetical protein